MTLIEVVIAIAIMGVIVGAVYEFLIFANRETYAADTKEEIVEEVNLFFLRVSQDIRNAKNVRFLILIIHWSYLGVKLSINGMRTMKRKRV